MLIAKQSEWSTKALPFLGSAVQAEVTRSPRGILRADRNAIDGAATGEQRWRHGMRDSTLWRHVGPRAPEYGRSVASCPHPCKETTRSRANAGLKTLQTAIAPLRGSEWFARRESGRGCDLAPSRGTSPPELRPSEACT